MVVVYEQESTPEATTEPFLRISTDFDVGLSKTINWIYSKDE